MITPCAVWPVAWGNLPVVEAGAASTEGTLGNNRAADAFETRGRYVGITRRTLKVPKQPWK